MPRSQRRVLRLPRMPRTSARPSDDPTERTTDLIAASATVWRLERRRAARSGAEAAGSSSRSRRCRRRSPARPARAAGVLLLRARAAFAPGFWPPSSAASRTPIRGRPSCRTGRRPGFRAISLLALLRRDRAEPRGRRADQRALDHRRHALFLERRDQRLADAELGDRRRRSRNPGLGRNVSAAVRTAFCSRGV